MRILLIKTSSMGDVIHTLPALSDAQQSIPGISVDWVVEEGFAAIPLWHRVVRKVIPVAWRRWRQDWVGSWRSSEISNFIHQVRAEKYDFIIDAQGLYKSAIIAVLAHGIGCGYCFRTAREPLVSLFYQRNFWVDTKLHAVTRIRQLLAQALGYKIVTPLTLLPDARSIGLIDYGIIESLKKDKAHVEGKLLENINSNGKYLVFIHSASRGDKLWPQEKWVELAQLAVARGFSVLLPSGNREERVRAQAISQGVTTVCPSSSNIYFDLLPHQPRVYVLPQLDLSSIAHLLLHSRGAVAVDTGLAHLAAALEIPTIALYGPTSPVLIGVIGKQVEHLNGLRQVAAQEVWNKVERLMPRT